MTYLPRLRDQVIAAAGPGRTQSRRRTFVAFSAGAFAIAVASGALAATGVIPIGTPLPTSRDTYVTGDPHRGAGTIVPSTVRLLALRVADPDGGPPWGMRVVTTTRGVGCVQVGRVVDGKLGTLGQDGVAADDGRFHELAPTAVEPWDCQPLDTAGALFVTVMGNAFMASGPSQTRRCLPPGLHVRGRAPCPAADVRRLQYGLLGPHAASVTYEAGGRTHTAQVTGPDGAFLIVDHSMTRYGGTAPSPAPVVGVSRAGRADYPLRRVDYRDGSACPDLATQRPAIVVCPLPGYQRPTSPAPTTTQVRRPLSVRRSGAGITITFRAPVAVAGAGSAYTVETRYGGTARCRRLAGGQSTDHDIAAGQLVTLKLATPDFCRGRVRGTVRLLTDAASGTPQPHSEASAGPVVGTFSLP
jgi:hypothetical protein